MEKVTCKISFRDNQNWQDIDGNVFFWESYTEKHYSLNRPIFNGLVTEKEIDDERGGITTRLQTSFGHEYYVDLLLRENELKGLSRMLYTRFVRFEYSNGIAHEPYEPVEFEFSDYSDNIYVKKLRITYKIGLTVTTPCLYLDGTGGTTLQFYNVEENGFIKEINGETAFDGNYTYAYNVEGLFSNVGGYIQFEFDLDYYWRELSVGDTINISFFDNPTNVVTVSAITTDKITLSTTLLYSTKAQILEDYPNVTFSWTGDGMQITYKTSNVPKLLEKEVVIKSDKETGVEIPEEQINNLRKELKLWVLQDDAIVIDKFINLCNTVKITEENGNVDTAIENVKTTLNDVDGEQLYEVTITYIYEQIVYHKFRDE